MKKLIRSAMIVFGLLLVPWYPVQAGPLGTAGDFNLFVFDSIEQSGTDVEGRVAGGGNVSYTGFSIASKVEDKQGLPDLVAGGNLRLANGSVGFLTKENSGGPQSQRGTIAYGGTAQIGSDVGYQTITKLSPIDFAAEKNHLRNLSSSWGALAPTGIVERPNNGQVFFTGGNPNLNIFNWDTSTLGTKQAFFLNVPMGSTVLINITDSNKKVALVDSGFYIAKSFMPTGYFAQNDLEAMAKYFEGDLYDDYPNSKILFNLATITDLTIDLIEINGSILAPWADISFEKNSHIDGNLIGMNLSGNGESHNIRFDGQVSVPEPATLILLGSGLMGIAALRRRMKP